jgi:cytochrome c oxidase assembly protein subunit 15
MNATLSSGQPASPESDRAIARRSFNRLVAFTLVLTLFLIMLGAYVRLTDAGLGCPDWPGCYGKLTPTMASEHISAAVTEQGGEHGPVSMGKAWREMVHRYIASGLGLLIIAIAVLAWRRREQLGQSPWLATSLVGVVILQGLFGKWTVTLLLKPAIVTGHLLGGMLTFSLLLWLWCRQQAQPRYVDPEPMASLIGPARIALALVSLQIFLGGWTSTNYAALACTDFPTCQGQWWPDTNFRDGFHFFRELGKTGDGALLPLQALTGIHLVHRLGAVLVLLVVGWVGMRTIRVEAGRGLGIAILAMLAVQWSLGLANIWLSLPLPVAVAHNGGAAVLLGLVLVLNYRAFRASLRV